VKRSHFPENIFGLRGIVHLIFHLDVNIQSFFWLIVNSVQLCK
jgi:hypothetical protein